MPHVLSVLSARLIVLTIAFHIAACRQQQGFRHGFRVFLHRFKMSSSSFRWKMASIRSFFLLPTSTL